MKRRNKILISYLLLLTIAFTTLFANVSTGKAATLTGEIDSESITTTTNEKGQTIYTLTRSMDQNDAEMHIVLTNGETAILDGNGNTLFVYQLVIEGSGTLIFRNIQIIGGTEKPVIETRGIYDDSEHSHIQLIFQGKEPITVRSNGCWESCTDHYNAFSLNTYTNVDIEDGSNVTISGYGRETDVVDTDNVGLLFTCIAYGQALGFINVGPKANLTLQTRQFSNGYINKQGCIGTHLLVFPTSIFSENDVITRSGYSDERFNIATVVNGSISHSEEYRALEVTSIEKRNLPTYFGSKYEFVKYYTDAACTTELGSAFNITGGGKTIYAKCNQLKADVTFDSNGGSSINAQEVTCNNRLTMPTDPTRSGYIFKGWYKDATLAQPYDFNTPVTGDFKLYAKWEKVVPITTPTMPGTKPFKFSVSKAAYQANSLTLSTGSKATFTKGKLTYSWKPVKGATGYKIYAALCGKKPILVKTVKGQNISKATISKLNGKALSNSNAYMIYAVAYKTVNNIDYNLGESLLAFVAGSKNKNYTNIASLKVKKSAINLKLKKTTKIKVSIKKKDKKKKLLPTSHCARLRYISSNTSIASVSSTGKITAKKKGKCTIYAVAMNGRSTKMTITVS